MCSSDLLHNNNFLVARLALEALHNNKIGCIIILLYTRMHSISNAMVQLEVEGLIEDGSPRIHGRTA